MKQSVRRKPAAGTFEFAHRDEFVRGLVGIGTMPVARPVFIRRILASGIASFVICGLAETARSQTAEPAPAPSPAQNAPATPSANAPATVLPQTNVQAPKQAAKPPKQKPRAVAREATPAGPVQAPLSPAAQAAAQLAAKNGAFDQARGNIFTTVG